MPLNVRRFYTSALLVFVGLISFSFAQTVPPATQPSPQAANPNPQTANPQSAAAAPVRTPTAGEIMRDRISRAKAYIAVRNYNAAAYELENIRRETADQSVQAVVNVLLMNSYLEQGDYKKAQDFLNQAYSLQKTTKSSATATYIAVASQVVKSARNRAERYRALGLNPSDRTLPLEAINDIEKMRETLEIVITQTKDVGKDKNKTEDAMALLEEAANSRGMLARDDYDARHWKDEVADTREQITSSRSIVVNAVNDGMPDTPANQAKQLPSQPPANQVASASQSDNKPSFQNPAPSSSQTVKAADSASGSLVQKTVMQSPVNPPVTTQQQPVNAPAGPTVPAGNTPANPDTSKTDKQEPSKTLDVGNQKPGNAEAAKTEAPVNPPDPSKNTGPLDVGSSLISYATRQQQPVYPAMAKSMRASGTVRVDVTIDEKGDVAEVQKTTGPSLLVGAAKDAIKKWQFRPFVRDGQPVKATGFVNFNFSL